MAVEPLYNESKDALLLRARIKTVDDVQSVALIDQSIQEVRLGFFQRLGKTRAKTITGYSYTENPDSDEEVLRVTAAATEANWLRYLLIQRLPHLSMAADSTVRDLWNEEPLTRDSGYLNEYLKQLKEEIDKGMGALREPEGTNSGSFKSSYNVPDDQYLNSVEFKGLHAGRNGGLNYG